MSRRVLVLIAICCALNSYAQHPGFLLVDLGANQPFNRGYKVGYSSEISVGIATIKKYNQFVISAAVNSFHYYPPGFSNSTQLGTLEFSYRSYPNGKGWYLYPAAGIYKELDFPDVDLAIAIGSGYQFAVGKHGSFDIFTKLNALRGGFYWLNLGVGFQLGNQLK